MASDIIMVKDHSAREETRCRHMGYCFRLAARVLLYASSHRQANTYHGLCYTSRGALAGMRNSSMGPRWRIDPTTHRTMSECFTSILQFTHAWFLIWLVINNNVLNKESRRSSMVERQLMVWCVIGSIPYDAPNELSLVLTSASQLVQQRPWNVLSCSWDGAYNVSPAANRKK